MIISTKKIIINLFSICLLTIVLIKTKEFLIPITIGFVISTLFYPICKWLEKKGINRGLASIICILTLISFLIIIILIVSWQISIITNDIEALKESIKVTGNKIQDLIYSKLGITINKQTQILNEQINSINNLIPTIANTFSIGIAHVILTLVYIFCFLYYRNHLKIFIVKINSIENKINTELLIYKVANISQQYLFGLAKMIVCLWVMYGIGFSIIGIKNAWFFAILCGLLEIIPYAGNLTGTIITTLIVALQGGTPLTLISIIGTYAVIQFIQGWVLEPLIVGAQVKINPFFTILSLIIGQLIWGLSGVFLAIPIIAMIKIICDNIESLKPYGYLISEIENNKIKISFTHKIKNWIDARNNK